MTEKRTPSVTTYMIVCALLIVLTVLTVTVSFFDLPGIWHVVLGLCIAAVKGALVVVFFMHALISSRVTWIVIAVACFWLCLLLMLGLTDYFTRGLVPFMTGH
ncbi:MAG TPA: caa(3)-type oxidase subunit IV [Planctomycetales bacterium]|jgi:cytochrome c oxidase subunit 4|nr:caa(3)-type oxidase subunit IV [Planctomycetales bacterium]